MAREPLLTLLAHPLATWRTFWNSPAEKYDICTPEGRIEAICLKFGELRVYVEPGEMPIFETAPDGALYVYRLTKPDGTVELCGPGANEWIWAAEGEDYVAKYAADGTITMLL